MTKNRRGADAMPERQRKKVIKKILAEGNNAKHRVGHDFPENESKKNRNPKQNKI